MDKRQKIFMGIVGLFLLAIIGIIIYYIVTDPEIEENKVPTIVETVQTADD